MYLDVIINEVRGTPKGEGDYPSITDVEARGCGEQTGLETPVVHTVKYECYPRTKLIRF